jgi:dTDP-4-dehydrorhamnose reductase
MRVAIIGTSGQLATELRQSPLSAGFTLARACKLDLADAGATRAYLDAERPELVLNAAAYTAVDRAEDEPSLAHAVNGEGAGTLATWCAEHAAALFHVSTDYVFDGNAAAPYTEDTPTHPINTYGASKLLGERLVRERLPQHLILRTSWLFSSIGKNFVRTMLELAKQRSELRVVADQLGSPTPVRGLAEAMWKLASRLGRDGELAWGTYHFAGQPATSWFELAVASIEAGARHGGGAPSMIPIRSDEYPTRARRPKYSVLDCSRFRATFDLPLPDWRAAVADVASEALAAPR